MSFDRKKEAGIPATVLSAETMLDAIEALGIVPFFENPILGYSIEEMTSRENWFDGQEDLRQTPWDWKIPCVQSGDVAYGKFLWGGKAAFATVEWYAELMNWRRSREKYQPLPDQQQVLAYLAEHGSIGIKEIRALLGVKKSAADALMTRLQMQCRVVTGDIARVYRGPDLHYNGWQVSSFCTPESLFCADALPGPGGFPFGEARTLEVDHSPDESLTRLTEHIRSIAPQATEKQILKMLA
ncbi:MAG: winged helix-turn-helix transcriptional regulator [Bacteroidales bacterium]|nr:winged helix-turn-helix transcriptional regulator [Bacteroidales bacterium]